MLPTLDQIAKALHPTCREVESAIVGHPPELVEYWARSNSVRHAHTVRELLAVKGPAASLRVLNASGLSCGHQDFAISRCFGQLAIPIDWVALESARSPYLANAEFRRLASATRISIREVDYSSPAPLAVVDGEFDAILFTEIAEHLDHTALLRSLTSLRPLLAENGRLILTTPNLLVIGTRLKFLLGIGDAPYWGDGQANLREGLFGHIVNYDRGRIGRLLKDSGFEPVSSYTFDYQPEPGGLGSRMARSLLKAIVPHSRSTIFISARKGDAQSIPFQI